MEHQLVTLGDLAIGTTTRPIGPTKATPMEVSSTETIVSQTIELLGWTRKRPIRVLLDSGSTSNYISDRQARSFNSIIQLEVGSEQPTLADGSKMKV